MEMSHIISETVLASAGFFSFFLFLRKLEILDRILWGTFILLVAVAALCAALRYAGFSEM
jgi:di/tricarboxylate transporter